MKTGIAPGTKWVALCLPFFQYLFFTANLPFLFQFRFATANLRLYKDLKSSIIPESNPIPEASLNWTANKTALIELGYAFKVAKCFGANISAKEIVSKLAKLFNVDMPENYIYKKYNEMRVRGRNSRTYFMDTLSSSLNDFMISQDMDD